MNLLFISLILIRKFKYLKTKITSTASGYQEGVPNKIIFSFYIIIFEYFCSEFF